MVNTCLLPVMMGVSNNSIFTLGKKFTTTKKIHESCIDAIALTNVTKYLSTACDDKGVKQSNIEIHQQVYHHKGIHENDINAIALTSDGRYLFTANQGESVRQFNIETHQVVYHYKKIRD